MFSKLTLPIFEKNVLNSKFAHLGNYTIYTLKQSKMSYTIIYITIMSIGSVVGPFDRIHSPGHWFKCLLLYRWYRKTEPAASYFPSRDKRRLPFMKYLPLDIRNAEISDFKNLYLSVFQTKELMSKRYTRGMN